MSHIRVLICRVDEAEQMTEVAAYDLAGGSEVRLEAAHALDDLEARTRRMGNAMLRQLLQARWELIDLLVAKRQKVGGRQWSLLSSDSLAALRTLQLNGGWDRYWEQGEVLPLAAY